MRLSYFPITLAVGVALFAGSPAVAEEAAICPAETAWIEAPELFDGSEPEDAEDECAFYQRAWQAFLHVTRPDVEGRPAFLDYANYLSLFEPEAAPEGPGPVFDGGIYQALSGALIDGNGNPLYYAIEVDPVFADFIIARKLNDLSVVRDPAVRPEIPNGAIEMKSAWQIIEDKSRYAGFITASAEAQPLKKPGAGIELDEAAAPRRVDVALLGIHVVFKLDNHPELIWATFEHVGPDGEFDLVPRAGALPGEVADTSAPVSASKDYLLYHPGTSYEANNQELWPAEVMADGRVDGRSSIYRAYPWSQARVETPPGGESIDPMAEDGDIAALNLAMRGVFKGDFAGDPRKNYKLVGAVWLRKGAEAFRVGELTDDEDLLGERGLSNAALESMTQESSPHCFSCHSPVREGGMPAKAINVSRIFAKFSGAH